MSVATTLLAKYEEAILAVLDAQSYTINNRSVTLADLSDLEKGRDKYKREVSKEARGGMKVGAFTCVDK
ncbi:MAG: hypothetical protein KAR42_18055 [candidate division Zixibacteria bacterium]|nr:hypothetical protein [candidate division Zixibacteria bacterium]